MKLFQPGACEGLKGGVHGAIGLLAAVCCGYNAVAWVLRGQAHHAANVAVYASLTVYEAHLVAHHVSLRGPVR